MVAICLLFLSLASSCPAGPMSSRYGFLSRNMNDLEPPVELPIATYAHTRPQLNHTYPTQCSELCDGCYCDRWSDDSALPSTTPYPPLDDQAPCTRISRSQPLLGPTGHQTVSTWAAPEGIWEGWESHLVDPLSPDRLRHAWACLLPHAHRLAAEVFEYLTRLWQCIREGIAMHYAQWAHTLNFYGWGRKRLRRLKRACHRERRKVRRSIARGHRHLLVHNTARGKASITFQLFLNLLRLNFKTPLIMSYATWLCVRHLLHKSGRSLLDLHAEVMHRARTQDQNATLAPHLNDAIGFGPILDFTNSELLIIPFGRAKDLIKTWDKNVPSDPVTIDPSNHIFSVSPTSIHGNKGVALSPLNAKPCLGSASTWYDLQHACHSLISRLPRNMPPLSAIQSTIKCEAMHLGFAGDT